MIINFACTKCGNFLQAYPDQGGESVPCNACGAMVTVPPPAPLMPPGVAPGVPSGVPSGAPPGSYFAKPGAGFAPPPGAGFAPPPPQHAGFAAPPGQGGFAPPGAGLAPPPPPHAGFAPPPEAEGNSFKPPLAFNAPRSDALPMAAAINIQYYGITILAVVGLLAFIIVAVMGASAAVGGGRRSGGGNGLQIFILLGYIGGLTTLVIGQRRMMGVPSSRDLGPAGAAFFVTASLLAIKVASIVVTKTGLFQPSSMGGVNLLLNFLFLIGLVEQALSITAWVLTGLILRATFTQVGADAAGAGVNVGTSMGAIGAGLIAVIALAVLLLIKGSTGLAMALGDVGLVVCLFGGLVLQIVGCVVWSRKLHALRGLLDDFIRRGGRAGPGPTLAYRVDNPFDQQPPQG